MPYRVNHHYRWNGAGANHAPRPKLATAEQGVAIIGRLLQRNSQGSDDINLIPAQKVAARDSHITCGDLVILTEPGSTNYEAGHTFSTAQYPNATRVQRAELTWRGTNISDRNDVLVQKVDGAASYTRFDIRIQDDQADTPVDQAFIIMDSDPTPVTWDVRQGDFRVATAAEADYLAQGLHDFGY